MARQRALEGYIWPLSLKFPTPISGQWLVVVPRSSSFVAQDNVLLGSVGSALNFRTSEKVNIQSQEKAINNFCGKV